jgi:hypothetical protein
VREDDVGLGVDPERLGVGLRGVQQVPGGVVGAALAGRRQRGLVGDVGDVDPTTVPSLCLAIADPRVMRCFSVAGFDSGTITR